MPIENEKQSFSKKKALCMSDSTKSKALQRLMDHTDTAYLLELLHDAIRNEEWDTIHEAIDFLKEYLDDDGGPIELEE